MRKIFITFLFITLFSNTSLAQSKISSELSRIENNLFGIEYSKQTDNERLSRIEERVYGEAKSGNIKSRLFDLSNDVATNLIGQEITPKRDTFDDEEEKFEQQKLAQSQAEEYVEPDNPKIDYDGLQLGKYSSINYSSGLGYENFIFNKKYYDGDNGFTQELNKKILLTMYLEMILGVNFNRYIYSYLNAMLMIDTVIIFDIIFVIVTRSHIT